MPTYEYRCSSCGEVTEAVQAFTDAPLTVCPACGEAALRKLFGKVGVVFKGSGFYRTDSRAESKNGSAKESKNADAAKNGAAAPAGSGSGKADSGKGDSQAGGEARPKSQPAKPAAPAAV